MRIETGTPIPQKDNLKIEAIASRAVQEFVSAYGKGEQNGVRARSDGFVYNNESRWALQVWQSSKPNNWMI